VQLCSWVCVCWFNAMRWCMPKGTGLAVKGIATAIFRQTLPSTLTLHLRAFLLTSSAALENLGWRFLCCTQHLHCGSDVCVYLMSLCLSVRLARLPRDAAPCPMALPARSRDKTAWQWPRCTALGARWQVGRRQAGVLDD
jgi:hypothetical protein